MYYVENILSDKNYMEIFNLAVVCTLFSWILYVKRSKLSGIYTSKEKGRERVCDRERERNYGEYSF